MVISRLYDQIIVYLKKEKLGCIPAILRIDEVLITRGKYHEPAEKKR